MSFDDAVLEVILLIPRGRFTTYKDVATTAGSGNRYLEVGKVARERAPQVSHRVVKRVKGNFLISRGYNVSIGDDFRHAIDMLEKEGISVSDAGVIQTPKRYLDAEALGRLLAKAQSAKK